MMKFPYLALSLSLLATISGCSDPAPRSAEYFAAHLDEARQVVSECTDGSVHGDECANASLAVEMAEGRERFRRFRGK